MLKTGVKSIIVGLFLFSFAGADLIDISTLHDNSSWQRLGKGDGVSDGVSWSINGGDYVNDVFDLEVGDKVIFKFDMYKELWGTHTYDAIRVWFGEGALEDLDVSDIIVDDKWAFNYSGSGYTDNSAARDKYYAKKSNFFFSDEIIFSDVGDYSLLARVTCSRDLIASSSFSDGSNPKIPTAEQLALFTPDKYYWQGEAEAYHFSVTKVPEPATLVLLCMGLSGFAFFGRKKRS